MEHELGFIDSSWVSSTAVWLWGALLQLWWWWKEAGFEGQLFSTTILWTRSARASLVLSVWRRLSRHLYSGTTGCRWLGIISDVSCAQTNWCPRTCRLSSTKTYLFWQVLCFGIESIHKWPSSNSTVRYRPHMKLTWCLPSTTPVCLCNLGHGHVLLWCHQLA